MGRFDDVLKTITDAQEVEAIRASLAKNPETAKALSQIEFLAKDGAAYLDWYKTDYPKYQTAYETLPQVQKDLADAQQIIVELKGGKRADDGVRKDEEVDMAEMTREQLHSEIQATIKAGGFVTTSEAKRMADEAATAAAAAAQGRVYTHGLPMVERMIMVTDKFRKDFGKDMDRKAFGKFIEENRFSDVDVAYADFTKEEYSNKIKAESFEQGKILGAKEAAERYAKESSDSALRSLPVDMGGSPGFVSRPGEAPKPVAMADIPADYQLGQRGGFKLSHAVAAQIEADKAAGKQSA